jgi:hypothetical protein
MRKRLCTIGGAVLLLAVFVLSAVPGASAITTTILPGTVHEETVSADAEDSITYSWNTDGDVRFMIRGPGGVALVNVIDDSRFDIFEVTQSGTYRLTWENLEATVVTLDYSVDVLPFSGLDEFWDMATWSFLAIVIGAIVFTAVIIILLVVLLTGEKKRAPQGYVVPPNQPYGQYQYAASTHVWPPVAAGTCPKCSASIDPQSVFCPRCGAKLR